MTQAAVDVSKPAAPPPGPAFLRRFDLGDIEDMGAWLLRRLGPRYPHLSEKNIAGFLRSCVAMNTFLFLRTRDAVCLAQATHRPLMPGVIVEEIFCLQRGKSWDEARGLYPRMLEWAKGLGAAELYVDIFSDVPKAEIQDELGRVFLRQSAFVKVA